MLLASRASREMFEAASAEEVSELYGDSEVALVASRASREMFEAARAEEVSELYGDSEGALVASRASREMFEAASAEEVSELSDVDSALILATSLVMPNLLRRCSGNIALRLIPKEDGATTYSADKAQCPPSVETRDSTFAEQPRARATGAQPREAREARAGYGAAPFRRPLDFMSKYVASTLWQAGDGLEPAARSPALA